VVKALAILRAVAIDRTTSARGAVETYLARGQRRASLLRLVFVGLVVVPTLLSAFYYTLIASPRFVSEAQFSVTKAANSKPSGLDALLRSFGVSQTVDDTSIVTGYLMSRDALAAVAKELPIREIFSRREADLLSRFPRFWRGDTFERLFDYFQDRVSVTQDPKTGLSVLRVETFRPVDSQALAEILLKLAENAVNGLNRRLEKDSLDLAWSELGRAQQKLVDAQQALTEFRNRELLVDPTKNSTASLDTITKLSGDLAMILAQKQQIETTAPASPAVRSLAARAEALQSQIADERSRLAGGDSSLAPTVSKYERLTLLRDLAEKDVGAAQGALEAARLETQRQHLYIQKPIVPNLADESTEPQRLRAITTVLVTGFMIFAFIWILTVGAGEHAHQ
jgi:capsular polysaccharide transport system permease protein